MSDHISIREIAAQEIVLLAFNCLNQRIRDLRTLHPGPLLERNNIGRNLTVGFQFFAEFSAAVSVPEIGHMSVLLRLRNRILLQPGLYQHFRQGMLDFRRINQEAPGQIQIAVILKHAGIYHVRPRAPVKIGEVFIFKGHAQLNRTVAAEVKENYAVLILNRSDRRSVFGNNKGRQVLIDHTRIFLPVRFNGFPGGSKHAAFALYMRLPAFLHHAPVGLIPVHCNLHTAAAAGDFSIEGIIAKLGQNLLQLIHIGQGGSSRNVPSVQKNVYPNLLYALFLRLTQHFQQMLNIAVYIAVREKPDEMKDGIICLAIVPTSLPGLGGINLSAVNGFIHQLRALGIDLTAAQRVMSHFAVAHVIIAGQTHSRSVRLQRDMRAPCHQPVQRRRMSLRYRISQMSFADPDTVHYDQ